MGINHHEAHLYSPWIRSNPASVGLTSAARRRAASATDRQHSQRRLPGFADFSAFQPNVSLIVSGGHTLLVLVESALKHRVLGSTVDDAAGECFDKTGKLMGLPYPAGPEIDRLAEQGNPKAYDFPRPLLNDPGDDFSFSGLKTSVRYFLRDHPGILDDAQRLRDLCASIQAAIVEVLVKKTIRAAKRNHVRCVTASGGVTCNRALRRELARACEREGFRIAIGGKKSVHRQRGDGGHIGGIQTHARRGGRFIGRGNPAGNEFGIHLPLIWPVTRPSVWAKPNNPADSMFVG